MEILGNTRLLLNETYGFASGALAAPQANAMAAVIDPLMNGVGAPWPLYALGAVIAIILTLCKVPALAFALGMFIPMELNVPLLIGGAVSWYVTTRSKDAEVNKSAGMSPLAQRMLRSTRLVARKVTSSPLVSLPVVR